MKKLILALLAFYALQPIRAMQQPLALAPEDNSIVQDFLYNHAKFKALWGTPEKGGTNYHKLPKEIAQRIAHEALAPALAMLKKSPAMVIALRSVSKTFFDEPISYTSRKEWNYFACNATDNPTCPQLCEAHPMTKLAATISTDCSVQIWDTRKGTCIQKLIGHAKPVSSFQFDPTGQLIATGSDETVRIWDAHSGACLHSFNRICGKHQTLRFTKDGKTLFISHNNVVEWRDVETGKRNFHIIILQSGTYLNLKGTFLNIALNDEETHLIGLHPGEKEGYGITIWDIKSAKCIRSLNGTFCDEGDNIELSNNAFLQRPSKKIVCLWDIGRYFKAITYFDTLTLEQAILLNCLAHTILINKIITEKHRYKDKEFLSKMKRYFDFSQFPHLQTYFKSLPLEIQYGFHHHVILHDEEDSWCTII